MRERERMPDPFTKDTEFQRVNCYTKMGKSDENNVDKM